MYCDNITLFYFYNFFKKKIFFLKNVHSYRVCSFKSNGQSNPYQVDEFFSNFRSFVVMFIFIQILIAHYVCEKFKP